MVKGQGGLSFWREVRPIVVSGGRMEEGEGE
jgi:hypothetical protein